jgi:hypothetical protein
MSSDQVWDNVLHHLSMLTANVKYLEANCRKANTSWQPIESAPKDKKFLVRYRDKTTIGWFNGEDLFLEGSQDEYGHRSVCHGGMYGKVATHWMPLPEPPTESA